jgi:dienelactone hydrolase
MDTKIIEIEVPVTINSRKKTVVVTIFRNSTQIKSPYLIINHGRPPPSNQNPVQYKNVSEYFCNRGFVVIVPTRYGYADNEEDIESANCIAYEKVFETITDEVRQVLEYCLDTYKYIERKGYIVGQSVGGFASIALAAAKNIEGLIGAINFSGGHGGSLSREKNPCGENKIREAYTVYGRNNKVPTLWLYSLNDLFWGAELPRAWFRAFQDNGGKGDFVQLPSFKDNGHNIFSGSIEDWKEPVQNFIASLSSSTVKNMARPTPSTTYVTLKIIKENGATYELSYKD